MCHMIQCLYEKGSWNSHCWLLHCFLFPWDTQPTVPCWIMLIHELLQGLLYPKACTQPLLGKFPQVCCITYCWEHDPPSLPGWWFQPSWKILVNGKDYPHILWKIKNVWNHQPDKFSIRDISDIPSFQLTVWRPLAMGHAHRVPENSSSTKHPNIYHTPESRNHKTLKKRKLAMLRTMLFQQIYPPKVHFFCDSIGIL